jgi:hypothetical protein
MQGEYGVAAQAIDDIQVVIHKYRVSGAAVRQS